MGQTRRGDDLSRPKPGEALRRALAARGADISVSEAARLSRELLDLIDMGLIVPAKKREPMAAESESVGFLPNQEVKAGTVQISSACSNPVSPCARVIGTASAGFIPATGVAATTVIS
jgi:hypothetical protein